MFQFPPVPSPILAHLQEDASFVVIGHVSPDGDCLSSELAMGALLERMGKEVLLANAGPFERTEIKPLAEKFARTIPAAFLAKRPTVVIVDCSAKDRIGSLYDEVKDLHTLVIDHHASGDRFGDDTYIVPDSPSASLLVQRVWEALGYVIDERTARSLFFGFCTDTGFFRFLNAGQGEALRSVASLVDAGASPNMTFMRMTGGKSFSFVKYLGLLIDRATLELDGRVVVTEALLSDRPSYANDKPSDLFYTQALSIAGVQVVLLLKEKEDGCCEVGLRASHDSKVDVGAVAASFGGGGHAHASGMTVRAPLSTVKSNLLHSIALALS